MGNEEAGQSSADTGVEIQFGAGSHDGPGARVDRGRGFRRRVALSAVAILPFGLMPLASAFPAQAGVTSGNKVAQSPRTPTFTKILTGASIADMYSSGLEWDAVNQRLVVADTGNNEIEFYTFSTGSWTRTGQFGSSGSAPGQLNSPRDIAIDGSGNIYVADAGNSRIQKFTSTGTPVWATTGSQSKCLYTQRNTTCTNQPIGVSWDPATNDLLVADTGDSYIKEFDASGNWVSTSPVGKGVKTNLGAGDPRDAMRGPGGYIWVSAYDQNQIKAYQVTGTGGAQTWTLEVTLGDGSKGGHGVNQLIFPYNIEFSPDAKTAYVSDIGNDRIAVYDISNLSSPVWQGQYGRRCTLPCAYPKDSAKFLFLRRVVVATNGPNAGDVIGDDFWGNQINVWAPPAGGVLGAFVEQIEGVHAPAPGVAQAFGVATAPSGTTAGTVYVVDRLNQRVEERSPTGAWVKDSGVRGVGVDAFSWPEGAAVAPDGTVWLADTRNSRLEHWPADLTVPSPYPNVGTKGPGVGQFNYIEGLTVDSHGVVWVADTNNNRIESYNPSTSTFTVFGSLGSGSCQFNHPQAVAVSPGGAVYVADTLNNRIVEMNVSGSGCSSFASTYSTGLSGPQGVALAGDGTVWVADSGHNLIDHLTSSLSNIGDGFGGSGNGNSQFNNPHSLAVFGTTLYVADTYNNRVQQFDITGS